MITEKKSENINNILPWFKELFIYNGALTGNIIYPQAQRMAFIDLTAIISIYDYEQKCLVNDDFKNYTFIVLSNEDPYRSSYDNKPNLILYTKEDVLKMMADAYIQKQIFLNNARDRVTMVNKPEIIPDFTGFDKIDQRKRVKK